MPRTYRLSPEGKARLQANAAKARDVRESPDNLVTRIERAKERLTPEHIARLSALLASASTTEGAGES